MRKIQTALLLSLVALNQGAWAQTDAARALLNQGQAQQAADAYGQRIAREPGDPDHWLGRALARIRLGQWAGAMADLEKAVALAPGYADAWSSLADVYRWNDRPAAAADAYARLAALRPNDPQVRRADGRARRQRGGHAQPAGGFRRAPLGPVGRGCAYLIWRCQRARQQRGPAPLQRLRFYCG